MISIIDVLFYENGIPIGIIQDGEVFHLDLLDDAADFDDEECLYSSILDLGLWFDCTVTPIYGSTASYVDENGEEQFLLLDDEDSIVNIDSETFFIEEESNENGDIIGYLIARNE